MKSVGMSLDLAHNISKNGSKILKREQRLHLHPADVAPKTQSRPCTKSEEEAVHVSIVLLHPSLGTEALDIVAIDLPIAMDDPRVYTNDCTGREVFTSDASTSGWDDSR